MGIFSRKQKVNCEEYCRKYYEQVILNPIIKGIGPETIYFDKVIKSIAEADQNLSHITSEKLASEMIPLRFELFALAWMHKFVGDFTIPQSVFTKHYLHEKGRDDVWNGMEHYNKYIHSATLHWLNNLGKMNLAFWYNMRNNLTQNNIEKSKKMGLEIDEVIVRVNNRLCSENAWKQRIIPGSLAFALCEKFGLDYLNKEAGSRLAKSIQGLYEGSYESLASIKIKD